MSHITNSISISDSKKSLMVDLSRVRIPSDPNGHIAIGNVGRTSGYKVSQSIPMDGDHDTKCSLDWDTSGRKHLCQE